MVNYSNSKIYKLEGNGLVYIGSTTRLLSERMNEHKQQKKGFDKGIKKRSCSSRLCIEENTKITLLENWSCNSKEELLSRERYWYDNIDCVNITKPKRTEEEKNTQYKYYPTQPQKDKKKEKSRQRYAENVEYESDRKKVYYLENKEKIDKRNREKYEKNKKEISERRKVLRQNKKDLAKNIILE